MLSSPKHNLVPNDSNLVRSLTSLRLEPDFCAGIHYSNQARCGNDDSWGRDKGCDEKTSEMLTKTATTCKSCDARGAHAGTQPTSGLPATGAAIRMRTLTKRSASRSDPKLDRGLPSNRISCAHTQTGQRSAESSEQKLLRACASEQEAQGGCAGIQVRRGVGQLRTEFEAVCFALAAEVAQCQSLPTDRRKTGQLVRHAGDSRAKGTCSRAENGRGRPPSMYESKDPKKLVSPANRARGKSAVEHSSAQSRQKGGLGGRMWRAGAARSRGCTAPPRYFMT